MKKLAEPWRNRIVGHGTESPEQLLANPNNFRIHPKEQQDALGTALSTLGVIQTVIVNQKTQHVIDGHLRIQLAITKGETAIPVTYVDLSEQEEALALATFDPLSAMAGTDDEKLRGLVGELPEDLQAVVDLIGLDPGEGEDPTAKEEKLGVVVDVETEREQHELLKRLRGEGYTCKAKR